ncbi:DUF4158 domain-containing protein [Spirillospora sp. CA-253888]
MAFDFLSDEQVARYGRFPQEPSPGELERFFWLDQAALEQVGERRSPTTKLGWAVQWGTVRMLGVFLTEVLGRRPAHRALLLGVSAPGSPGRGTRARLTLMRSPARPYSRVTAASTWLTVAGACLAVPIRCRRQPVAAPSAPTTSAKASGGVGGVLGEPGGVGAGLALVGPGGAERRRRSPVLPIRFGRARRRLGTAASREDFQGGITGLP